MWGRETHSWGSQRSFSEEVPFEQRCKRSHVTLLGWEFQEEKMSPLPTTCRITQEEKKYISYSPYFFCSSDIPWWLKLYENFLRFILLLIKHWQKYKKARKCVKFQGKTCYCNTFLFWMFPSQCRQGSTCSPGQINVFETSLQKKRESKPYLCTLSTVVIHGDLC